MLLAGGLVLLLLFLGPMRARAVTPQETITQLAHTSWGPQQGIADVVAIAQTRDGYLWVGTSEGLFCFDGTTFSRWQPRLGEKFAGSSVTALCAGNDGCLWIGCDHGVSRLKDRALTNYTTAEGVPPGEVTSVLQDHEGTVWVATTRGLARLVNGHWYAESRDNGFPEGSVRVECEDGGGVLWFAVDDPAVAGGAMVGWLRRGQNRIELLPEHLGTVAKVCPAPDGQVWIAETTGAVRPLALDQSGARIQSAGLAIPSRNILFDRDGTLWICTVGRGLVRVADVRQLDAARGAPSARADAFTEKDGLSGDYVTCGFEDREGTLWFGTTGGLDRFRENKIASYSVREGLNFDQRLMLAAGVDGSIWAGSEQGLQRMRERSVETVGLDWIGPGLVNGVYSFHAEPAGDIWIGAQNGVGQIRGGARASVEIDGGMEMNNVTAITRDRADGLWLCDQLRGVCRVANGKPRIFPTSPQLPAEVVNSALTDARGRVWLGFQDGTVSVYEDREFHRYAVPQSVMALLCDRAGQVWAAGLGGLSRFKAGGFETLTAANGLPSTELSGLVEDNDGFFWLAGHSAVFRVSPKDLEKAFADGSYLIHPDVYGASDGLRGFPRRSRPFPSAIKASDGRLWFATTAGLAVIDPAHIRQNLVAPPVHIVQVMIDGRRVEAGQNIQFPAGTRDVKIHFTALSLADPDKVQFRCQLEGFDENWSQPSPSRQAAYQDLAPKAYRFRVTACNNDGVWTEQGAEWRFSIRPAFYQTTWFFMIVAATCAVGLWGLHRWHLAGVTARAEARLNTRLEAQADERRRIAQELHDTLLQGFTGVRLKLWAIAHQLPDSLPAAKEQLKNVIQQADQCLAESRSSVWALRSPRLEGAEDFASALSQAAAQLVAGTPWQLDFQVIGAPRKLSGVVEFNLLRIGQELVTNAVKHAQGGRIELRIQFEPRRVGLQVNDDGRGFDPEHTHTPQIEHQGLAGVHERVRLLGGTLEIRSRPGEHTEITVSVPA